MPFSFLSRKKKKDRVFKTLFRKNFGFRINDVSIYRQAFLHKSLNANNTVNNERLEFLGDSILGSITAEVLYDKYPGEGEGFMSGLRSKLVNRKTLNDLAIKIGLEKFLKFDKSSGLSRESSPDIYGNALEAFIGAIYLDKGYRFTHKYIRLHLINDNINLEKLKDTELNFKGRLYEYGQKNEKEVIFEIDEVNGGSSNYEAKVYIDGILMGIGAGSKKKTAEQHAAKDALHKLKTYR